MPSQETQGRKYTIPKEEVVVTSILEILEDAMTIRSQTLFHKLVMSRLKDTGLKRFCLSPQRLRRITARLKNVDLLIHCREGDRNYLRNNCPVCGTPMEDIKNSTLYGWTVSTGKACPVCSYWTGTKERIPIRYVFILEKEKLIGDNVKRMSENE